MAEHEQEPPLAPWRELLSTEQLRARRALALRRRSRRRIRALVLIIVVPGVAAAVVLIASGSVKLSSRGGVAARASTGRGSGGSGGEPRAGPKPVIFTVEASGDLLIHSPVWERALVLGGGSHYDFAPLFARIRPTIRRTDLPLCHVETPMTPAPPKGYPVFNAPPELARAIHQTGWRACSTAATHSLDEGQTGVDDTIAALNHAHVLHTGTFSSAAARRMPLLIRVKGILVGFLSYTELTNGIPSPHPWSVNRAQDTGEILADAARARRAGARAVIVNIHWGDENVTQPSAFQLALARRLTRSPDITAVVGQHVHVVQPIRTINGKPVVFGEGNLISNQTRACCPTASQDGMIALLTIRIDARGARVTFVHYVPIWVRHPDYTVLPAAQSIRSDPGDAAALRASWERTVAAVGRGRHIQPVPAHLK